MGLEVMNHISDFNADWPLSTDKRRQGDDHLRGIKRAIQNTFPNINGAVTATDEMLNSIPANLGPIITEILLHLEAPGSIKMWDLANAAIPAGWVLCDGAVVSGYGTVPDMRDRFVIGAGPSHAAGTTGGDSSVNTGDAGGHTPEIQGQALTMANLPADSPRLFVWESGTNGPGQMEHFASGGIGPAQGVAGNADANTYAYRKTTVGGNNLIENLGSGTEHTHIADAVPDHNHTVVVEPPYYSAVFIVKVEGYEAP